MYCGSLVQGWPLYYDNNRMIISNKFYIPKNNKIDYQRPSLLLWRKFQRPLTDIFNLNKAPESDFYITPIQLQTITSMSALRDIRRWEQGAVEINPIEALFKYSKETFNTNYAVKNPSDNSRYSPGLKMPYWDTNFLNDTKQLTPKQQNSCWYSATHIWYGAAGLQPIAKVVVSGNDYFNYNSDETTDIVEACKKTRGGKAVNVFEYGDTINGSTVTYHGIKNKDLAHWLFFNAVILKTVTTLPLAQDNNFALENRILGAFQNFLHIITFGLVPRWSRVPANQHPGFPFMAGLFPAGVLDNYRNLFNYSESGKTLASAANAVMNFAAGGGVLKPILGAGSEVSNPLGENHLPLNIFADNEMSLWFGAKNTTTAIAGELSHVITTDTFKLNGTKTTRMTVTTGDIGQQITIKGSSGKYTEKRVVLINEATKIESRDTVLSDYAEKPSGACVGYMINQRHDCVLGGKTIQDKYFSLQSTDTGGELTIKDQNCIYYDMVQTRNSFNKNLRLIWNHRRIGNPLFNFGLDPDDPNFSYPDDLMPVPPDPLPSYTWSYNLKTFESGDWSGFFSQSPDTSKLRGCFNTQIKDKSYFIKATNWIIFPETTISYDWISGKQLTSSGSHGGIVFALPFKPLRNATDWIRKVTTYFSFNGVVQSKTSINLMLNSAIKNPSRIFNFSSPAQKIEWSGEVITYFDKPQTVRTKISKQKQVYFFINPFATFNINRVSGHDSYTVSQPIYAKFDAYWDFTLINGYDLTTAYIKIEFDVIIDYPNQTINPVANLKFSLTTDNDNTLNYHAKNNYAYQGGKRGVAFTGDAAQYLDKYYNGVVFSDLKISTQIKEAVIHDYKN